MRLICLSLCLLLVTGSFAQNAFENGNTAYLARDFKQAISYYERAIMDNPANLDLQAKLANCYRFINEMDKAEKYYAKVTKNSATNPINHYWYAMVLKANKKYDEAIAALNTYAKYNQSLAQKAIAACTFAKNNINAQSAFFVAKEGISSVKYDDYSPVLHQGDLLISSSRKIKHASIPGGFSDPATQNFTFRSKRKEDGQLVGLTIVKGEGMFLPANNMAPFDVTEDETKGVSTFNMFADGVRHIRDATFVALSMEVHQMQSIEDFPPGEKFPFQKQDDKVSASFPCITNNGNTVYFAADGLEGSHGGYDIYVTHRQNNSWTKPQNLGPNVNTPGDEISPFVTANKDLFFASDFHKGFGGYDIYRSKNVANVWRDVRNLGPQVNSPKDDMYFVYDVAKRIGYFASNRNGNYDIYSAILKGDENLLMPVNDAEANVVVNNPTNNNNTNNNTNNNNNSTNNNSANNNNNSTANNNANNNNNSNVGNTTYSDNNKVNNDSNYNKYNNNNTNNSTANNNTTNNNTTTPKVGDKPTVGHNEPGTVPCAMNFYIGSVVDAQTKRPLKDAIVYIKNQKTGEERKVKDPTNIYGEYSVILDPLADYTVAISKAGFKNLVFDVNTGTGGKKTLLGNRAMVAAGTVVRDKWGNIVDSGDPSINTTPSEEELSNPPRSTKYYSYQPNNKERLPAVGYAIQAIVTSKLSQKQRFYLNQFGNILTEKKGKAIAYQVGVFVDEQHMQETLQEIQKTYKDAFKVPVRLNTNKVGGKIAASAQVIYPPQPQLPEGVTARGGDTPVATDDSPTIKENNYDNWATNDNTPPPANEEPTTTTGVEFKVQLGAFKDPEGIAFSNLNHIGLVEKQKRSNGLTYFYISSFKTLEAARNARSQAKTSGIESPFIVAFKNGRRVKISDVVSAN